MAFAEFTFEDVENKLDLKMRDRQLFPEVVSRTPPDWLLDWWSLTSPTSFLNEKSRGEMFVYPTLQAVREQSQNRVMVFSGERFDVDASLDLVGDWDFMISSGSDIQDTIAPLAPVVQAKRQEIEAGVPQCIAQMYATRLFYEREGRTDFPPYGCVTNGEAWYFLKLEKRLTLLDSKRFYHADPGKLLGVWHRIISEALAVVTPS
jgi:hypothetical protein